MAFSIKSERESASGYDIVTYYNLHIVMNVYINIQYKLTGFNIADALNHHVRL